MKFNGRNVYVSDKAKIGSNVRVGDNTVIYDHVVIEDNSIICNDCVIGEPLAAYYHDSNYENPPTVIGAGALIRSHAIIYAGSTIGKGFSTGHRVTIRCNSRIGENTAIGTLCDLQGHVNIGKYCRLHSNVHLARGSCLGDFVFLFPYVVMTNDPIPPSDDQIGASIGNYSVVGVHAVILPGIKVGENCLIGANSRVNKRVMDYSLATGDPLKVIMDVRDYMVMGKGKPYPWMTRFGRGMPWEQMGFEAWKNRTGHE
jgi:acetyltransferase-like isoleucine patch superfamily enzyme